MGGAKAVSLTDRSNPCSCLAPYYREWIKSKQARKEQQRRNREGNKMQITDVRVRRIEKEGKMKAIVSITLDNEFVIHDIKVIEGEKGLFIAMPSRKAADGEYRDIAHPINSETRDMIQRVILDKYETTTLESEASQ